MTSSGGKTQSIQDWKEKSIGSTRGFWMYYLDCTWEEGLIWAAQGRICAVYWNHPAFIWGGSSVWIHVHEGGYFLWNVPHFAECGSTWRLFGSWRVIWTWISRISDQNCAAGRIKRLFWIHFQRAVMVPPPYLHHSMVQFTCSGVDAWEIAKQPLNVSQCCKLNKRGIRTAG